MDGLHALAVAVAAAALAGAAPPDAGPRGAAERFVAATFAYPGRGDYAVRLVRPGLALVDVRLLPRPGTTAEPAQYELRLTRRDGRWRVAGYRGGARGCRRTLGGSRDPDPGATILWC